MRIIDYIKNWFAEYKTVKLMVFNKPPHLALRGFTRSDSKTFDVTENQTW